MGQAGRLRDKVRKTRARRCPLIQTIDARQGEGRRGSTKRAFMDVVRKIMLVVVVTKGQIICCGDSGRRQPKHEDE